MEIRLEQLKGTMTRQYSYDFYKGIITKLFKDSESMFKQHEEMAQRVHKARQDYNREKSKLEFEETAIPVEKDVDEGPQFKASDPFKDIDIPGTATEIPKEDQIAFARKIAEMNEHDQFEKVGRTMRGEQ